MKPATRVLDVTTNMTGERVGMTIDDSALAHIMSVLTDLYSDPELACIREYSTNALDAHIQDGVTRPIEVNIPSSLSPFLSIRDYGEGLDVNDIHEIYSRYGTSTKRESNDVVGMLGLGCKSALTYTDQFTLTAIKNGKMIQVSISRDEDGSGSMTILDERDSDLPSGVEVMIPAKFGNQFEAKAKQFFAYWEKGTVLVNGKQPERIDGIWLSDDLCLIGPDSFINPGQSIIVMGNVPYPALPEFSASYGGYSSIHTVAFVDIGAVHFTPSRETLQATKQTKETLTTIKARVKKEKETKFAQMIEDCATRFDAYEMYSKVKRLGYQGDPSYKGQKIPLQWFPPTHIGTDQYGRNQTLYDYNFVVVNKVKSLYRRSKNWNITHNLSHVPGKNAWVTGYSSDQFTAYKREKMEQYFSKNLLPESVESIVFVPTLPDGVKEWTDPNTIFKWSDIEAEKIVRANIKRGDGRPTGSYKGYIAGTSKNDIIAGEIDITKPLFWIHSHGNLYYKPDGFYVMLEKNPDATLIVLGGNRIEKFKRDFPMAINLETYCTETAKNWGKALSDDDRLALYLVINDDEARKLRVLDEKKIDDPELVDAITLCKSTQKHGKTLKDQFDKLARWGVSYDKVSWKNPIDRYNLLTSIYSYGTLTGVTKDHLYLYMNAVYNAAEKEEA